MIRKLLSISLLMALPLVSSLAQQKPDFSGTWKLNVAKSEFGQLPGPTSRMDVITHKEPSLSYSVTLEGAQGKQEFSVTYTTDGKESLNTLGPLEFKSIVKWVGGNLFEVTKFVYNGTDVNSEATTFLSPDGRTMTVNIHFSTSMFETDQKLIFEKQAAGPAATPPKPSS
jgi:hypothetical protein